MSFPNYKTIKRRFLLWKYDKEIPDEWEDLDDVLPYGKEINGKRWFVNPICQICYHNLRVGKEKGIIFRFCPLCKTKE